MVVVVEGPGFVLSSVWSYFSNPLCASLAELPLYLLCVKSVYVRCVSVCLPLFVCLHIWFMCWSLLIDMLCVHPWCVYVRVFVRARTRLLLAGDTARALMMEIIRNFLQLGRWLQRGGGAAGRVGCEWVRKRGEVRVKEVWVGGCMRVWGGVCM